LCVLQVAQAILISRKIRHPNVVLFMGIITAPYFGIVSELCENGDLYHFMRNRKR
jgi:serine/threonine protein kinase